MNNVAILIPARGGSKRVHRKNLRILKNKPLISYAIESALKSKVGNVYVSTEDKTIKKIAIQNGAEVIDRPSILSGDKVPLVDVVNHFLKKVKCDTIVMCEATNPFILNIDIQDALNKFFDIKCDSLITLQNRKLFLWKRINDDFAKPVGFNPSSRPFTQEYEGWYSEDVDLTISKVSSFKKYHSMVSGRVGYYVVPHISIDIDNEIDFKIAELLIKEQNKS